MRKPVLGIIIAVVTLLAIIGVIMANRPLNPNNQSVTQSPAPSSPQSSQTEETDNQQPAPQTDNQSERNVEIINAAFNPATITIKKGTTVTWTNKDSDEHTVTPDQESANFTGSGMLGQNETYSFTFNTAGTYSYHCQPHPHMKGAIIVTE